jgi:glycosyltransferase involved in cell wall biosynthesis
MQNMNPGTRQELASTAYRELYRSTVYHSPAITPISPSRSELDVSIFVACYNEEGNIIDAMEMVVSAMTEVACSWEIIVIDDASSDKSVSLVKQFMSAHPDYPITLVVREENQGLAQNYIEGAFLGRGKYYKLVCGDNVEAREQLVSVLRHMGEVDMVIPYFVQSVGRSFFRMTVSRTFTFLVNLVSGYQMRYYNGVGVFQRYDVMRWHTNYHGFSFQADLITRLLDQGKTYIEIPGETKERASGSSKALTMKNFLSVAHFFLDLAIRRVGRVYRRSGTGPTA